DLRSAHASRQGLGGRAPQHCAAPARRSAPADAPSAAYDFALRQSYVTRLTHRVVRTTHGRSHNMSNSTIDLAALQASAADLDRRYEAFKDKKLALDMTRGKPCSEQLDLSNELLTNLGP